MKYVGFIFIGAGLGTIIGSFIVPVNSVVGSLDRKVDKFFITSQLQSGIMMIGIGIILLAILKDK